MRTSLVVGAAPSMDAEAFYRNLLTAYDRVVAADAAGEWCVSLGRVPDIVVGDFDSAAPGAADRLLALGSKTVRLACEKDLSDLDAAIDAAIASGSASIDITAAFTGRPDHTLSAFGSLARAGGLVPAGAREPGWHAVAVSPTRPYLGDLAAGTTFTVLAPAGAHAVRITGARFPLDDSDLDVLSSRGLSNVALGGRVCVEVGQGILFVIVLADGDAA
jgi:thiamine pyrophosphokinase